MPDRCTPEITGERAEVERLLREAVARQGAVVPVDEPNAFSVEEARTAREEGQSLRRWCGNAPSIHRALVDEWRDAATRLRRQIARDQRSLAHYLHAIEGAEDAPEQEN